MHEQEAFFFVVVAVQAFLSFIFVLRLAQMIAYPKDKNCFPNGRCVNLRPWRSKRKYVKKEGCEDKREGCPMWAKRGDGHFLFFVSLVFLLCFFFLHDLLMHELIDSLDPICDMNEVIFGPDSVPGF